MSVSNIESYTQNILLYTYWINIMKDSMVLSIYIWMVCMVYIFHSPWKSITLCGVRKNKMFLFFFPGVRNV